MTLGQIVADTLGVAVYPSLDHEASARGAALLALEAMGILPDVAQVPAHLKPPVQPDAAKHAVYRKAAERQQKLYQELLEEGPGLFPNSSYRPIRLAAEIDNVRPMLGMKKRHGD